MDRRYIRERVVKNYGEFANITQVAEFIGCTRETARRILRGYTCLDTGRSKLYTADDISKAIVERSSQ